MKKTALFFLATSVVIAQGPRGGGPGRGLGMFGGPEAYVTGAPYSAVEQVQRQESFADGNAINTKTQTNVFRDSQGRVRTEETITPLAASGKQPYTRATILDFVGGHRYVLDSSTMTAFESPLHAPRAGAAAARRGPEAAAGGQAPAARGPRGAAAASPGASGEPQVVRTTLSPQSVNGVLASGTQHTETISAGQIGNARPIQVSRTVWMSNDLKVPVQIKSADPRFGSTQMDLTNIVQAEPSASLFLVPAGYTVKSGGGRGFGGPGGPHPQMRRPAQQ